MDFRLLSGESEKRNQRVKGAMHRLRRTAYLLFPTLEPVHKLQHS